MTTSSSRQPQPNHKLFHPWGGYLQLAFGRRHWRIIHQFTFGLLKSVQNNLPAKNDRGPLRKLQFYVLLNGRENDDKLASMHTVVPVFMDLQGYDGDKHLYYDGHWKVQSIERFPKEWPLYSRYYIHCMKIELAWVLLNAHLTLLLGSQCSNLHCAVDDDNAQSMHSFRSLSFFYILLAMIVAPPVMDSIS